MKILLVAVNAKYIHSNLAIHYLKSYAREYEEQIRIVEYTINHQTEDILKGIYKENPDVIAFSAYIWNMDMITQLAEEVKQIMPQVDIWFGGPEVSYVPENCLERNPSVKGVMIGEGEQTFYEVASYYITGQNSLLGIKGISYRDQEDNIILTGNRSPISMDAIPFPYDDIEAFRNKIIYYESSRGCPYSCSYCLSSVEQGVRFRSLDLVKKELKSFLDHGVAQVKFVDRTFNCNRNRTMELWKFIKENDNMITNFHFEITGDILREEELLLLSELRPGQVQLEIGVQSTNPATMDAIRRNVDFVKLSKNVMRIKESRNIHQHLDLIAGLPFEGYESFAKSFDDVYRLKPDQLQLGFLKILYGSYMEKESDSYGIVYRKTPPYEVLSTADLTYGEILRLKGVCDMVEVYYNSGQFQYSLEYMEHFYDRPFDLYERLADYYEEQSLFIMSHSRLRRYEILLDFFLQETYQVTCKGDSSNHNNTMGDLQKVKAEQEDVFKQILLFDMCLREGIKNRPGFAPEINSNDKLHMLKKIRGKMKGQTHIEHFHYDIVESTHMGKMVKKDYYLLFEYSMRDPITNGAIYSEIDME